MALPMVAQAQTKTEKVDSLVNRVNFYYEINQVYPGDAQQNSLDVVLDWMKANPGMKVKVNGYADKTGSAEINQKTANMRANIVADYLGRNGVSADLIEANGYGVDSEAFVDSLARRVDVLQYVEIERVVACNDEAEEVATAPEVVEVIKEVEVVKEVEVEVPAKIAHEFSLRTNLLYWCGGLINIGAEYRYDRIGLIINGGYSPFQSESWNYNSGGWFVSPEVRYYMGSKRQWFVGASVLAGDVNFKFDEIGREGTVYTAGLTGGYRLELNKSLDMDFSLGLGYARFNYHTYEHNADDTNTQTTPNMIKKFVFPTQVGVSLIWKL